MRAKPHTASWKTEFVRCLKIYEVMEKVPPAVHFVPRGNRRWEYHFQEYSSECDDHRDGFDVDGCRLPRIEESWSWEGFGEPWHYQSFSTPPWRWVHSHYCYDSKCHWRLAWPPDIRRRKRKQYTWKHRELRALANLDRQTPRSRGGSTD